MDAPRVVVVVYATAAGSTAGIARHIADALSRAGCAVRCLPATEDPDLDDVDALVVGSAVHDMAWLPPALDVLRRAAAAGPRSVWCFSVGAVNPRGRLTRAVAALEARRVGLTFPSGLPIRDHRVFGGILEFSGISLWGHLFYRLTGGRAGDHRDWPAIEAWACGIADAVLTSAAQR
jgi:menaquinone-dependent protoporphyrinogen oxidase